MIAKAFSVFKEAGIQPNLKSFENRIIMQKLICLLDLKGIKTGYEFNIYVRGPYSPELTKDIYENEKNFIKLSTFVLSSEEKETIKKIKKTIGFEVANLEIATTYAFLVKKENMRPSQAIAHIKKTKGFYSTTQIIEASNNAKEFIFVPNVKLLKELNEEMSSWDTASDWM